MINSERDSLNLREVHQTIFNNIKKISNETIALQDAQQRVAFSDVIAAIPEPSFNEATRDGYVVYSSYRFRDKHKPI